MHIPTSLCTADSNTPIYGSELGAKVIWASGGRIPAAAGEGGRISGSLQETVEIL